jgi:nicotinamidase-related amidase
MELDTLTAAVRTELPVAAEALRLDDGDFGLIIVDVVNGFATVGAGNLAPPTENAQVARMVAESDRLARAFADKGWPVLAFLDTHEPGKPEPPYPPHCEAGTGEEELVPALKWLERAPVATLVRKDCINGFVGAIGADGKNAVVDWVNANEIETVLVVGICTDICVMDFVLTMLSARNHGLMPHCREFVVPAGGCATYDLPKAVAKEIGLPETASHPQNLTHHMGLYFMAARGARIVDDVVLP